MGVDRKVIDRIEKLIRLASPSSGTTDEERSVAALEATKLIDKYDLTIIPREHKTEIPRKRKPKGDVHPGGWVKTRAVNHTICCNCHKLISPGDTIWARVHGTHVEFFHNYRPCNLQTGQ